MSKKHCNNIHLKVAGSEKRHFDIIGMWRHYGRTRLRLTLPYVLPAFVPRSKELLVCSYFSCVLFVCRLSSYLELRLSGFIKGYKTEGYKKEGGGALSAYVRAVTCGYLLLAFRSLCPCMLSKFKSYFIKQQLTIP